MANLRPALEHVSGKHTQSTSILFLGANLPYDHSIRMKKPDRVRLKSVHNFCTCKKNASAHWQILTNFG